MEAIWEYFGFFSTVPVLGLLGFGMLYALNNFKLIICMTIKEKPQFFYKELLTPIIFGIILYVLKYVYHASSSTLTAVVLGHMAFEIIVLLIYYLVIIGEMAAHLKIPVFTVKKKTD